MEEYTVDCKKLVKGFGRREARVMALRGIDLQVRPNELMILLGPSGCGKTTLLSIIAGILDQDEGECHVFGQDLRKLSGRKAAHFRSHNIGFVFQSYHLVPTLTLTDNVAVPLLIKGASHRVAAQRARNLLGELGLGDRLGAYPRQLSVGQQQRVAIARALAHEPRLILCDEPTSALDHETGHHVMEILKDLATGEGRSLIVVTHDHRILSFADRIAEMEDGVVVNLRESPQEVER